MTSATNTNGSTDASTPVNPSSSSQEYPIDDPLFLHHVENPSLVLVTQPLIRGENLQLGLVQLEKLYSPRIN